MSDVEAAGANKSGRLPVSSLLTIDTPAEGDELSLVMQIGGYYCSPVGNEGAVELVRLIDWRWDSCHFQALGTADSMAGVEKLKEARPMVWHMPLPLTYLFSANLTYVGSKQFTSKDLDGYTAYLKMVGWEKIAIEETLFDLVRQSGKTPLAPVDMVFHNGEVVLK